MLTQAYPKVSYTFKDYILFVCSLLLFFTWLIIRIPTMSFQAEMYAEMATNFFYHTQYSDFLQNLKATDFGYLPIVTRMVVLFWDGVGVSIANIPYFYGYTGLFFVALFCASITLPQFRSFIRSDVLRFMTGLAFACYRDYDLNVLINCIYFGAIPYILILEQVPRLFETSKVKLLSLGFLLMLISLSKGIFLAFSIPLVLLLIWSIYQRYWNLLFLLIPPILALVLQALLVSSNKGAIYGDFYLVTHHLPTIIYSCYMYFFAILTAIATSGLFFFILPYPKWSLIFLSIAPVFFVYGGYRYFVSKRKNIFSQWSLILPLVMALSVTAICVVTLPYYQIHFGERPGAGVFNNRHWFVAVVSLFFLLVYFIDVLSIKVPSKAMILSIWIFIFPAFGTEQIFRQEPLVDWPQIGYSNWEAFASTIENQKDNPHDAFAPLDPYPWIYPWESKREIPKGALGYIVPPPSAEEVKSVLDNHLFALNSTKEFTTPTGISKASIYYVALILNRDLIDQNSGIRLEAFDAQGNLVGIAHRLTPDRGIFSFFKFENPTAGIATVRIHHDEDNHASLELAYNPQSPTKNLLWLWVGK